MAEWEVTVRVSLDLTMRVTAGSEADALIDAERVAHALPSSLRIVEHMEVRDLHAVAVREWA